MKSQARKNLDERLADIDQILKAHIDLTQFHKAHLEAKKLSGDLQSVANVVRALVQTPGKGKPAEVASLNRSAFVLLCAHLQGFVEDLHRETASYTLAGKVVSIEEVVKLVKPHNSNPHAKVIDKMFSGVGIYDLMKKPHWKKCANEVVRRRISKYLEERNKIVHGKKAAIHKATVEGFRKFVLLLADQLDAEVCKQIQALTKRKPW